MDASTKSEHYVYRVRPRKDHGVVDLISDALPSSVGCVTASQTQSATQLTTRSFDSRSHDAVIRVYDEAGNVIETHRHAGHFKAP